MYPFLKLRIAEFKKSIRKTHKVYITTSPFFSVLSSYSSTIPPPSVTFLIYYLARKTQYFSLQKIVSYTNSVFSENVGDRLTNLAMVNRELCLENRNLHGETGLQKMNSNSF